MRSLWRHYYANTEALIFVVDSNDRERIGEARDEFHRAIEDEGLRDAIILVFANKQDLPNGRLYMNVQSCAQYTACTTLVQKLLCTTML